MKVVSLKEFFLKGHATTCFLTQFNLNTASYSGMVSNCYFIYYIIITIIIVIIAFLFLATPTTESTTGKITIHRSSRFLKFDATQTIRYVLGTCIIHYLLCCLRQGGTR
jgi:uncharacterized membrane protein